MRNPFIREVIKEVEKSVYITVIPPLLEFKEDPPSPDELKGWKSERAGRYFIASLKAELDVIKEDMAVGFYTGESIDHSAQRTAEAIGRALQLRETIETLETLGSDEEEV